MPVGRSGRGDGVPSCDTSGEFELPPGLARCPNCANSLNSNEGDGTNPFFETVVVPDVRELDALKRFLFEYVEDLEALAVLAWLSEQPTALGQGREAAAKATGLPPSSVREALDRLVERGLVLRSEPEPAAFSYAPQDARAAALARRLLDEYRANPRQVMELMTKNSIERVKSAAAQTFAESFATSEPKKRS